MSKYGRQNGSHGNVVKHNGSVSQHSNSIWQLDDSLPIPKFTFREAACIVFAISILCFANSYNGDFVFDDSEAILTNKDLKPETPVHSLFQHDFWGNKLDSKTSHKSYRPLTVLTFRWSYSVAGGPHPIPFHVVNIILHGVVCVLMLSVFSVLLSGCNLNPDGKLVYGAPKSSFLCAVLFAVHPIHTESVAGIVGRADLLCALFFILSFLCYIKSCSQDFYNHKNFRQQVCRPHEFSVPWFTLSMVLCGLSVLCKEQGITVIGICSAYDIIVLCEIDILKVVKLKPKEKDDSEEESDEKAPVSEWMKSLILRHIFLIVAALTILVTRWRIMGSAPPTFQVFDNPHSFVESTLLRVINYNYLYSINIWLLLNPWWLCFDWSMGSIPVISSVSDPRLLAVIGLWVMLASLLYAALWGQLKQEQRILTMGLAMMIVPFLPATNLFFRVGFVVAERVLYLSTAGFCLIFVLGCQKISQYKNHRQGLKYAILFLVAIFTMRSMHRSNNWKTEMNLFESGAKVCPLNAKVHYNIAKINSDLGNTQEAIDKYRHAISLNPEYDQAMNNLANILKEEGHPMEAEKLLEKAVSLRPEFSAAWMNLGIVQATLNKIQASETSYFTALKHRRNYPDCYYNLGNLYLDTKQHQKALQAWRNATLLKPTHTNAWSNMVILLDNLNQIKEAELLGKESLKYVGHDPIPHFNLGNLLGKADRFKESEQYFLKAIELSKHAPSSKYYANLGVLYHRWGKMQESERAYRRALEINPKNAGVMENLQMLYRKFGKNV